MHMEKRILLVCDESIAYGHVGASTAARLSTLNSGLNLLDSNFQDEANFSSSTAEGFYPNDDIQRIMSFMTERLEAY